MNERIDVLAVLAQLAETLNEQAIKAGAHGSLWADELSEVRAAVAELIDAASRHVHAVDHPAMDGEDAARQARTLRTMSSALARVGGA